MPGNARDRARWALLSAASIVCAVLAAWFLQSTIPRHIVLASGLEDGLYHQNAQRYKDILARDGVTVRERLTGGAGDNARLLQDPGSGVDVAFVHGGVVRPAERGRLVMLAALHFEPLWVFHRDGISHTQLDELRHKRLAVGSPGSGVRAFVEPLLEANGITRSDADFVPLVNIAAVRALQAGQVDAAFLIGPVQSPAVWQALHDPNLKLMDLARADAYPRKFAYLQKLTLPPGTIDLAQEIPKQEVTLIGTKAMLVARDGLPPSIVNLLLDAARQLHGQQGYFEAANEFPNTSAVDLPVSADADRHYRFGPSLLHRYLPFFVATYVERLVALLVPLLFLIVPLSNLLPRVYRWRVRSRIYRWYGELALLEHDVGSRTGTLPVGQWLADLDRIEQAVVRIRTPVSFASEHYTLREHIGLVRQEVMAKAQSAGAGGLPAPARGTEAARGAP